MIDGMLTGGVVDGELTDGVVGLRPWRPGDAPVLAAAWTDPDISGRLPVPDDVSVEAARAWISGWEQRRAAGAAVDLAVTLADSDGRSPATAIGEVGLSGFEPARGAALVGWWLAPGYRGHGHASRALDLVARWALDRWLRVLVAVIDVDNRPSRRLAERCGFVSIGESDTGRLVFARTARFPQADVRA